MTAPQKLEMGNEIAHHCHIGEKNAFFGLKKKLIYLPTNSLLEGTEMYITKNSLTRLHQIMEAEPNTLDQLIDNGQPIEYDANGCGKVDICYSTDRQFVALQEFKYEGYLYRKCSDVSIYENDDAVKIAKLLGLE